ncbi:MAG: hypothetical protein RLZZ306_290 [Bacteroidota bacterium]|jgi:hypothetical protein
MYFPLIRGKQFELIALKDLSKQIANSTKVSPIIEPVKEGTAVLEKAIDTLMAYNINFTIILNPIEGEMKGGKKQIIADFIRRRLGDYDNFQIGLYVNSEEDFKKQYQFAIDNNFHKSNFILIHNEQLDDLETINEFIENYGVKYNVINFDRVSKRYDRKFDRKTVVTLSDAFKQQNRNSDYSNNTDEFFSEEYLYFSEDGYAGFSDYLTVGESYSEGGFLPYAVVIHLTYLDINQKIRIGHFVSDSNADAIDIAGKFAEAISKLMLFLKNYPHFKTSATLEFSDLYQKRHYPGLGTIKKLSIVNHIELIIQLLA